MLSQSKKTRRLARFFLVTKAHSLITRNQMGYRLSERAR